MVLVSGLTPNGHLAYNPGVIASGSSIVPVGQDSQSQTVARKFTRKRWDFEPLKLIDGWEAVNPALTNTPASGIMGGAAPRGAGAPPSAASLVNICQNRLEWTRQQKRSYHRIKSLLTYWLSHSYQVRWVMLSTAVGGDKAALAEHHKRLRRVIERKHGIAIKYSCVRTGEGNGVLHLLWAFKSVNFIYIPQDWLSTEWDRIHGATYVWIKRVDASSRSIKKLSIYNVSQYCGNQSCFERLSWSRSAVPFPLAHAWNHHKRLYRVMNREVLNGVPIATLYDGWEEMLTSSP